MTPEERSALRREGVDLLDAAKDAFIGVDGTLNITPNGIISPSQYGKELAELHETIRHLEGQLAVTEMQRQNYAQGEILWRGKYYETLHHLHTAHRGLERYARRQKRWREEVAGLRARLGVRDRLRRV